MKHLKGIFESHEEKLRNQAEALISAFSQAWRQHESTIGSYNFRYSDDIRDAKPGVVVSQYGDFFFILPHKITKLELPILDILLDEPFDGNLYSSRQDNKLQVRVSGFRAEEMTGLLP